MKKTSEASVIPRISYLAQLLKMVPGHGPMLQLQVLLPLLKQALLRPQALLSPFDRVPFQVDPVPEELQFRTAFILQRISKRIPQVVRVSLGAIRELVLQVF